MAAKILVVDDDPNVQRLLQYTLKQEGYEVVVAGDGAEGFRLWGAEAPDLILLDVNLPKLDGYQVATKIRTEEGSSSHVPIIMLTAEREVEQKVRGLRAGADDYLIKPFHPAELLARIKSLLARFAPKEALLARPPLGRIARVLRRQGRRRHDDHRDQRGDRAPSRARPQGRAGRRQPPVRRPPRVPRPRARSQEHRRRRVRAVDRRRPHRARSWSSTIRASTCCSRRPRPRPPSSSGPSTCRSSPSSWPAMYDYTLIDVDKRLDDINLGVFEAAETVFVVMTADLSCLKNVRLILETMDHLGYPAGKVQLVLNRSNAFTGINVKNAEGALKRTIEHQIVNEYRGAISALNSGAPFMFTKADSALGVVAPPFRAGGRQAGRGSRGGAGPLSRARPAPGRGPRAPGKRRITRG